MPRPRSRTRSRRLLAAAPVAVAVAVALAAAGCGGSSGPHAKGDSPDAKTTAQQLLALKQPSVAGITAVTCGRLDFALTYRCEIATKAETLVCSVPSGTTGTPYCIAAAQDAAERARRSRLAAAALARVNASGQLPKIVTGLRSGGFTVGCVLGFRTVNGGAAQTDDVVVELISVQTESGRSFWAALVVPPAGPVRSARGYDPAQKPPRNGLGSCDLDAQGKAAVAGEPRDTALLPAA